MQINVRVQVDRADEYVGKKGLVKNQVITCQDMDPSGVRLVNTFDYTMTPEEKDKFAGKLLDKDVTLGIYELIPFGGRLRARGKIVNVTGVETPTKK